MLVPNHFGVVGGVSFAASRRFTPLVFGVSTLTGEPLVPKTVVPTWHRVCSMIDANLFFLRGDLLFAWINTRQTLYV